MTAQKRKTVVEDCVNDGEYSSMSGWVEIEQGTSEVLDFPSCEEEKEGQDRKAGRATFKHGNTRVFELLVTSFPQLSRHFQPNITATY